MSNHADSDAVDARAVEAARTGDASGLATLLDRHPDRLHLRTAPYEQSLLHLAASAGHLDVVNLLLTRGLDANTLEKGDNTSAITGPRPPATSTSWCAWPMREATSSGTATIMRSR